MTCPECNGHTEVVDSRITPKGYIRRRRKCLYCGCRFSSLEITYDEYKQLSNHKHKCDGCEHKGEHTEVGYKAFGICKKESILWDAETSYKAAECPHFKSKTDLVEMR